MDSFLARARSLSAFRGIRFSLYPKITWNIKGDLHVRINGCVVHQITHMRLGYALGGESYSIYAVFPNIEKTAQKSTTYLCAKDYGL